MAWDYDLLDDDTTLNLNGGTDYAVLMGGFSAPAPRRRLVTSGNIFRHGSDLLERRYENRRVTLNLNILSTSQDDLITNINAINALLERGAEFATRGLGSQLKLRRQWNGATNSIDLHVLEGVLHIPESSVRHSVGTEMLGATLELLCKPFAFGSAETLESYVKNPSFQAAGTALADWTNTAHANHTIAFSRDITKFKYGPTESHSEKIALTAAAGAGTSTSIGETTSGEIGAGVVVSLAAWIEVTIYTGNVTGIRIKMDYHNASHASQGTDTSSDITATNTKFTQLTIANKTTPANTDHIHYSVEVETSGATATATFFVDGFILVKSATIPTAWVSGRDVSNHADDDGQAHLNYLDIYDVPGDVSALLQVKVTEDENHTKLWVGARHAGREIDNLPKLWNEGESYSGAGAWGTTVDANSSDGNYGRWNDATTTMSSSAASPDVVTEGEATPPVGLFRVLVRARYAGAAASLGVGYAYGDITKTPSVAGDYTALTTTFAVYDLGAVTVPPVAIPEGASAGSFTVRLAFYRTGGTTAEMHIDWVLLLPIDFGSAFASKTGATDVVLVDSRSSFKGITILNSTDVVQSIPADQLGIPPEAHPDGTRLFFVFDEGGGAAIDLNAQISITYEPRFLQVAPA